MLKKDNNFLQHGSKRPKGQTDSHKHITLNNKENINARSVFEHEPEILQKERSGEKSNIGSAIVSPTFQTNKDNLISLKGDVFKQPGYAEFKVNLKDIHQTSRGEIAGVPSSYFKDKIDAPELHEGMSVDQIKLRLIEHYRAQKYWKLLEKFFKQKDLKEFDVVLAWEDSISKHKAIKDENTILKEQIEKRNEVIQALQKQIDLDKNETRVVSQKKCKGCQSLEQKEKQYYELYEQFKKVNKEVKDLKIKEQDLHAYKKNYSKMQQKYLEQKFLKEQMEKKKNLLSQQLQEKKMKLKEQEIKLAQKENNEKQLENELIKYQSEQKIARKLHIQCEQLKEHQYQAQKSVSKMEEKYKKELAEITQAYNQLLQNKEICDEQFIKMKAELAQLKKNIAKMQFQIDRSKSDLQAKIIQFEQCKKSYNDLKDLEKVRRNDYEQKLKKAKELYEDSLNANNKLDFDLTNERKISEEKDEAINKYLDIIRDLQSKQKQCDSNESRGKQSQFYNLAKTKNPHSHSHNHSNSSTHGNLSFTPKIYFKIKEIYQEIKQITEQLIQCVPRRRLRDECDQRDSISSFQMEKYVNEIHSDFSDFINKFVYIQKQNQILKEKIENIEEESSAIIKQSKKEVSLKQQTLKAIIAFAPDDLKDYILDLLQAAEAIIIDEQSDEGDERFMQLQNTVKNQGKDWKQAYQRMKFKFGKMEDDIRRLEDENEDLKRRGRGKQIKKTLPTDYEYGRDMISRKDIRKKYNLDD